MSETRTLRETWPTSRKERQCEWCGETIRRGHRHYQFSGLYEGEFQTWRMHPECHGAYEAAGEPVFYPFEQERPDTTPTAREILEERQKHGQLRLVV